MNCTRMKKGKHIVNHCLLSSGVSLVEVLIALFILTAAFASIVTVWQSAGSETAFTTAHYSAMFVAQKVMEDVNAMVRDNPHAFNDLISAAEGDDASVVNGGSPYFRLLENTKNFGYLHEDDDTCLLAGPLYDQLKDFSVKVSSHNVPDPVSGAALPNLIEISVTVKWKPKNRKAGEYVSTQLIYGINDEMFKVAPNQTLSPGQKAMMDKGAIGYLAGVLGLATGSATLASVNAANPGANENAMMNLGRIAWLSDMGRITEDEFKKKISKLEEERDALKNLQTLENQLAFTDLQRQISSLYEQKAVQQIGYLLLMRQPIDEFMGAIDKNPLAKNKGKVVIGATLYYDCIEKVLRTLDSVFITIRIIPMALSTAEDIYLKLLNPPYLDLIPRGQEAFFFRKVLDIQKLGVLRQKAVADAMPPLRGLQQNFVLLVNRFSGKFPHFVTYLKKEQQFAQSYGSLQTQYKAISDVFSFVNELDGKVYALKKGLALEKEEEDKKKNN